MNWIQTVVDSFSENEAPERFFYWAALTALSATVRKKVYLNRYQYKLYPNIFTFLVAGSGMKKGLPVTTARTLVEKSGATRILMGRGSIQAIIRGLGKAYSTEKGGVIRDAQGFLVSGELAAFLVKDPDALTILTDLFDTHAYDSSPWINTLKGSGTENSVDKLKSPCLTILGATNEEHFEEAVPNTSVGGGFIARTFIVYSADRGTPNSLSHPPKVIPDLDKLSEYLVELTTMLDNLVEREFFWSESVKNLYDEWYYPHINKKHFDPTGTMGRLGDQVLKVAMLISLANGFDLEISKEHMFEAITVSEACIAGMQQVTMGSGKHNLASGTKLLLRELIMFPTHAVKKSEFLLKYFGQLDDFDLTRIAETLQAANAIVIVPQGKDMIYKIKKEALDIYTNFKHRANG